MSFQFELPSKFKSIPTKQDFFFSGCGYVTDAVRVLLPVEVARNASNACYVSVCIEHLFVGAMRTRLFHKIRFNVKNVFDSNQ
jgi:hypothetical protein